MDGTTEWQTFLEPEVDEGYAGVAVWGSMFPIDPVRQQVSHLQPAELVKGTCHSITLQEHSKAFLVWRFAADNLILYTPLIQI